MSQYKYAPAIIPMVFAEFAIIAIIVAVIYNKRRRQQLEVDAYATSRNFASVDTQNTTDRNSFYASVEDYFSGKAFERSYQSFRGIRWTGLLLFWRFAFLCYFCGVVFIFGYIAYHGRLYYFFTIWNIQIISLYYLLAFIASCIGFYDDYQRENSDLRGTMSSQGDRPLYYSTENSNWSDATIVLGNSVQILFSVVGSSALFITIVDFIILNPCFYFWNISMHLITSISFIIEMSLNSMQVRWEHVLLTLSWCLLYLCFIWPVVMTDLVHQWPYDFLALNTPNCFIWYSGLLLLNMCFYALWWGIAKLKIRYLRYELFLEDGDSYVSSTDTKEMLLPRGGTSGSGFSGGGGGGRRSNRKSNNIPVKNSFTGL